jgi:hypothetical protein
MAQHDFNIANQGFPAFRSDLNNALSAINSSQSGTSRPSGAVAGTIWLDTTNATTPTLKFYDGADDISLATIDYSANTVNWLDSSVVADLVNDTTPQLGGNLDANANNILIDGGNFIGDESGNEQIKFATTASAVNEVSVTNAATTNPPAISATGGDTNIDLNLTPKGIGRVTLGASKIQQVAEKVTNSATAATGTLNYDVITQSVLNYTSDATGNWTLNIRGDGSNSLDSIMDTGESLTIAHIVKQGGTAYYNSAFEIDGSSVTPEWQGGSAPSAGNVNSLDVYSYTIIKTGSATFTVLGSQTQFA